MIVLDSQFPPGWTDRTIRQRKRELREEQNRRIEYVRQSCRIAEQSIRIEIAQKIAALKVAKP